MTAEGGVHGEVSKGEIEEKCGLDMSSYQDLPKGSGGGGECNGVLHDELEEDGIIRNGKDDADGSYVFVNGSDASTDDPIDGDLNAKLNVASPSEEIEVRVGESKVENEENMQSRVEDSCTVEGTFLAPANNGVALDGDEEGRSDAVEEHKGTVGVESSPRKWIDSDVKVEEQINLESSRELEDSRESQVMVLEEAECELPQLDDGIVKYEEQNIVDSIAEIEETQESQITTTKSTELELNNGEMGEVEGESKSDSAADIKENPAPENSAVYIKENPEPENSVSEDVQLELAEKKEAAELGNEIPVEGCLRDHGMDMESDLEMAAFPVTDIRLETEVVNGSATDENGKSLPACHVKDGIQETKVINELLDGGQNKPERDGSSENAESLPLPVDCVRSEIEVKNVPLESGESLLGGPDNDSVVGPDDVTGASLLAENPPSLAVDDVSSATEVERFDAKIDESVRSSPADNAKSETEVANGPIESGESLVSDPDNDSVIEPDDGTGASLIAENSPSIAVDDVSSATEVETFDAKIGESVLSSPADNAKSEIEVPNGPIEGDSTSSIEGDSTSSCPANVVRSEPEISLNSINCEEKVPTPPHEDLNLEPDVSNGVIESACSRPIFVDESVLSSPADNAKSEIEVANGSIEGAGTSICSANDVRSKPEISLNSINCEEKVPTPPLEDVNLEPDVSNGVIESACSQPISVDESVLSSPADNAKSEIEVANGPIEGAGTSSCSANDVRSEPEISLNSINCEEKVPTPPHEDVNLEPDVSNGIIESACSQSIPVDDLDPGNDLAETESSLPNCPSAKSESEAENASALHSRDISSKDASVSEFEVLNGLVVNNGSALPCVHDAVDLEKEGVISAAGDGDDEQICQENELIEDIDRDETATSSPEDSSADALDGQNVGTEVEKRPFYFLIRIPRYDDENLREQIKRAQLQVDAKTQIRDAIRVDVQTKRVTCKKYGDNFEAAISEERTARDMLKSKRQEIDSVQSVINRVKNAMSVEEIDGRIRNMEHMIEHETLPLKEEKQIIREIKQLKQHREQLSSSMGRQDEVQQALDQRDQIEERLKSLKKEADLLRDNVLKAEVVTKAAKKKYFEETGKLNELQAKFKAADDTRQEAYAQLQNLRKQLSEKNKHFRTYKDDQKAANDYAINGDREALQRLCVNQVETVMELWNKNDEFRKEYIRCNIRSTLRRLRTLDGRSLGPDEEPPAVPNFVNGRVDKSLYAPAKGNSLSLISTLEREKLLVPAEAEKADDNSIAKVVEQKNQTAKTKKPGKPAPLGNGSATVSGRDENEVAKEEEHKPTKEEEELARKAEELRKEEAAAKLKEQRRLEEKAKAKEALERKKRNIDKAQARAELRAQKEAEQKEKEREKKARKKERKQAVAAEATNGIKDGDSGPNSETPTKNMEESEIREKPLAMTKRPQKLSQLTKQNKAKSIPPPLRNRGKRRVQPWMWVLLTALLVLALFLIGNGGFSFNLGLQRFRF